MFRVVTRIQWTAASQRFVDSNNIEAKKSLSLGKSIYSGMTLEREFHLTSPTTNISVERRCNLLINTRHFLALKTKKQQCSSKITYDFSVDGAITSRLLDRCWRLNATKGWVQSPFGLETKSPSLQTSVALTSITESPISTDIKFQIRGKLTPYESPRVWRSNLGTYIFQGACCVCCKFREPTQLPLWGAMR